MAEEMWGDMYEDLEFVETVDAVGRMLEEEFGPGRNWPWTWARRADLPECIIDAVFSIRSRNSDVERLIERWRRWQAAQGVEVRTMRKLAAFLAERPGLAPGNETEGGPGEKTMRVFPRNRVAGRFKTILVEEAALVFGDGLIETLDDFREVVERRPMSIRNEWMRVHGLGETSFCHLRLLAGVDALDPGVRVLRFLGVGRAVSVGWAKDVILGVADMMEVPPVAVEYALSLLAARSHVTPKGAERIGAERKGTEPKGAEPADGGADAA